MELLRRQLNLPMTPPEEPCSASSARQHRFSVSLYFEIWDHLEFSALASCQFRSTVSKFLLYFYAVVLLLLLLLLIRSCFSLLFVFSDRVCPRSPGCPGTHCVV